MLHFEDGEITLLDAEEIDLDDQFLFELEDNDKKKGKNKKGKQLYTTMEDEYSSPSSNGLLNTDSLDEELARINEQYGELVGEAIDNNNTTTTVTTAEKQEEKRQQELQQKAKQEHELGELRRKNRQEERERIKQEEIQVRALYIISPSLSRYQTNANHFLSIHYINNIYLYIYIYFYLENRTGESEERREEEKESGKNEEPKTIAPRYRSQTAR